MYAEYTFVVDPPEKWPPLRIGSLWQSRELIYFLIWRDLKVRYKQTSVGVAWAVFQPLFMVAIFTLVFSNYANISSGNIPYPVFALSGLMPWMYFANAVTFSSQSLVSNTSLVTRVFFPRIALPLASLLAALLDTVIALVLLGVMMAAYGVAPSWRIALLPILLLVLVLAAAGVGLWLSAINVRYRDVFYVVPFFIQTLFFLTPVVYPVTLVPAGALRILCGLNPMAGVVQSFRWALLDAPPPGWLGAAAAVEILCLASSGWLYFARTEQSFADVI